MVQLISSADELAELISLIPYKVLVLDDFSEISYPCAAKFLLTGEEVYVVTFSRVDFDRILKIQQQRAGIQGYEYIESEATDKEQGD